MTKPWPKVRLGEVLTRSAETVTISPEEEYWEITVKLWGKGVVLRRFVSGAEIAAARRFVAKAGQFILSRIDARNGAIGIVPVELAGAVVTSDFPLFDLNCNKLNAAYLGWLSKTADFVELCKRASEGTTNRVRLQEDRFLALGIPVPPLSEQRRIVARIEALAAKIDEAGRLRQQTIEEANALYPSALEKVFGRLVSTCPLKEIGDLCEVVRGGSPRPAGSPLYYGGPVPFIKVGDITKDEGKYLYEASGSVNELGKSQSRFIEADTLMLTNSGATLGVPKITKIAGCFNDGSQAFLNLAPHLDKEFLYYFLSSKTRWFRERIARGQGQPNLNTEMTRQMTVPVPSASEQRGTVAYLDDLQAKVDPLKKLQVETATELDALLPSILDKAYRGAL